MRASPKFVQATTGNDSIRESGKIYNHKHPVPIRYQGVPHLLLSHIYFSWESGKSYNFQSREMFSRSHFVSFFEGGQ